MSEGLKVLEEFVERYGPLAGETGTERLVEEVFGESPDPWQRELFRDFSRGERRISVSACHGPGKTWAAARMVVAQMLTRFPQKTVATAPSKNQLENALVGEVVAAFKKLPEPLRELFEVKKNRIELRAAPEESFFSASTARAESPEALQGVHSEHVLLIADEASGVPEPVFQSAQGSMSGHNATTLLLSNPTRTSGYFYETQRGPAAANWKRYRISAFDSSRVSDEFVREIAETYGEDSNVYRVRVLGEFPKTDEDTVIPLDYVEGAQNRDIIVPPGLSRVWGVDVARFGSDYNALVERNAIAVSPRVLRWGGLDLMQTSGKIKALWDETPPHERPEWILVDVIGLGAGVVDRLRELGLPARGVNVSESAAIGARFRNLRAELWFKARDWLGSLDHVLPRCPGGCPRDCEHVRLALELTQPRFKFTSSGKILVEPKEEMKKRGIKSPNVAEAFIMTFAADPAGLIHGPDYGWGSVSWREPIRRNRPLV